MKIKAWFEKYFFSRFDIMCCCQDCGFINPLFGNENQCPTCLSVNVIIYELRVV